MPCPYVDYIADHEAAEHFVCHQEQLPNHHHVERVQKMICMLIGSEVYSIVTARTFDKPTRWQ